MTFLLENFDAPAVNEDAERQAEELAQMEIEARINEAREEAYQEGYVSGERAMKAQIEQTNEFYSNAAQSLNSFLTGLPDIIDTELSDAFIAVVEQVLPTLADEGFAIEAGGAIKKASKLAGKGKLIVEVAPRRVALLEDELSALIESEQVTIIPRAGMPKVAVNARWDNTGVEFSFDQAIEDCIASLKTSVEKLQGE